jgi:hypothetical protein
MGFSSISPRPFLSHYVDATSGETDVPSIPARDTGILLAEKTLYVCRSVSSVDVAVDVADAD